MGNLKPQYLQQVIALCRRRGFVFQGTGESYAYGPLGTELKRNFVNEWWACTCTCFTYTWPRRLVVDQKAARRLLHAHIQVQASFEFCISLSVVFHLHRWHVIVTSNELVHALDPPHQRIEEKVYSRTCCHVHVMYLWLKCVPTEMWWRFAKQWQQYIWHRSTERWVSVWSPSTLIHCIYTVPPCNCTGALCYLSDCVKSMEMKVPFGMAQAGT